MEHKDEAHLLFPRTKNYLICVDSDGSVMDTMNSKHQKCFGPLLVEEWHLMDRQREILECWDHINLFSATRGVNRYIALNLILNELKEKGETIEGLDAFSTWVHSASELSDASLERALKENMEKDRDCTCMKKALTWSSRVNTRVSQLGENDKQAFSEAVKGIQSAFASADIAVVSSANSEALRTEWERQGLLPYTNVLLSQKDGTKADCIGMLLKLGYKRENTLMIGDAPGDAEAAKTHEIWFYPILASRENESWKRFSKEGLKYFVSGKWNEAYQRKLNQDFRDNLEY